MGIDPITLALAKKYTDSQRPCYEGYETIASLSKGDTYADLSKELFGLQVTDKKAGRRFLTDPTERPCNENATLLSAYKFSIYYNTYNGMLDKRCLLIGGDNLTAHCPSLFYDMSSYQGLMYAFEVTHDTAGMGVTFNKGWYVVSKDLTFKPVDMEQHPLVLHDEDIEQDGNSEYVNYLKQIFQLREELTYTVSKKNVMFYVNNMIVSYLEIYHLNDKTELENNDLVRVYIGSYLSSFRIQDNATCVSSDSVTVSRPVVKRLDPKYYDRLAWSEEAVNEILPPTTYHLSEDFVELPLTNIVAGQLYSVCINGVDYRCLCTESSIEDNDEQILLIYIGNASMVDPNSNTGTGEPFCIIYFSSDNTVALSSSYGNSELTIGISTVNEIVHQIDPKYVSGTTSSGGGISDTEIDALIASIE